jgi:hypothetical protein
MDATPRKRAKIAVLLNETNFSQRKIAEIVHVSQATVSRIQAKLKAGLNVAAGRVGKCGRKRVTTPRDETQYVRLRPGEEYHPDCVISTVKHPLSVMVWSVISSKGTGRLHIVEGTMRQAQYKRILQTKLIPQLSQWFPNGERYVFMQDGASCHTAKSVTRYLQSKHIPVSNSLEIHRI